MNEDAADALLKDLEEPPPYAVIVLVAAQPRRLPETIRSRCQPVPFRRLSLRALAAHVAVRRPDLGAAEQAAISRVAAGRLDRAERLLDPDAAAQRSRLLDLARTVYLDEDFDPAAAAAVVLGFATAAGARAAERDAEGAEGTAREREQRGKRVARGVEREEIGEALDLLAAWYRDVLAARCRRGCGRPERRPAPRARSGRRAGRSCRVGAGGRGGRRRTSHLPAQREPGAGARSAVRRAPPRARARDGGCLTTARTPGAVQVQVSRGKRGRRRLLPGREGLLLRSGRARARLGRPGDLPDVARPRVRPRRRDQPRACPSRPGG